MSISNPYDTLKSILRTYIDQGMYAPGKWHERKDLDDDGDDEPRPDTRPPLEERADIGVFDPHAKSFNPNVEKGRNAQEEITDKVESWLEQQPETEIPKMVFYTKEVNFNVPARIPASESNLLFTLMLNLSNRIEGFTAPVLSEKDASTPPGGSIVSLRYNYTQEEIDAGETPDPISKPMAEKLLREIDKMREEAAKKFKPKHRPERSFGDGYEIEKDVRFNFPLTYNWANHCGEYGINCVEIIEDRNHPGVASSSHEITGRVVTELEDAALMKEIAGQTLSRQKTFLRFDGPNVDEYMAAVFGVGKARHKA